MLQANDDHQTSAQYIFMFIKLDADLKTVSRSKDRPALYITIYNKDTWSASVAMHFLINFSFFFSSCFNPAFVLLLIFINIKYHKYSKKHFNAASRFFLAAALESCNESEWFLEPELWRNL